MYVLCRDDVHVDFGSGRGIRTIMFPLLAGVDIRVIGLERSGDPFKDSLMLQSKISSESYRPKVDFLNIDGSIIDSFEGVTGFSSYLGGRDPTKSVSSVEFDELFRKVLSSSTMKYIWCCRLDEKRFKSLQLPPEVSQRWTIFKLEGARQENNQHDVWIYIQHNFTASSNLDTNVQFNNLLTSSQKPSHKNKNQQQFSSRQLRPRLGAADPNFAVPSSLGKNPGQIGSSGAVHRQEVTKPSECREKVSCNKNPVEGSDSTLTCGKEILQTIMKEFEPKALVNSIISAMSESSKKGFMNGLSDDKKFKDTLEKTIQSSLEKTIQSSFKPVLAEVSRVVKASVDHTKTVRKAEQTQLQKQIDKSIESAVKTSLKNALDNHLPNKSMEKVDELKIVELQKLNKKLLDRSEQSGKLFEKELKEIKNVISRFEAESNKDSLVVFVGELKKSLTDIKERLDIFTTMSEVDKTLTSQPDILKTIEQMFEKQSKDELKQSVGKLATRKDLKNLFKLEKEKQKRKKLEAMLQSGSPELRETQYPRFSQVPESQDCGTAFYQQPSPSRQSAHPGNSFDVCRHSDGTNENFRSDPRSVGRGQPWHAANSARPSFKRKATVHWSPNEVIEWLTSLNMPEKVRQAFVQEEISGAQLASLDDSFLSEKLCVQKHQMTALKTAIQNAVYGHNVDA